MSDMIQPDPNHNPQEPIAFCQNCSTILTHETIRKVGANVFCEPCLAARLASAPPPPTGSAGAPDYGPVNAGGNPYPGASYAPPPVSPNGVPNPGLAALLGLIPGVGAMYNEQYAKGVAHLLIFAVLVMFSHIADIFGLFVFGWICYMAIDAHHTAKARRDGTPLPNPFNLNDIGDRMGFTPSPGQPWSRDVAAAAREAARDATQYAATGFNRPPIVTPPPSTNQTPTWGAPTDSYYKPPTYAPPYTQQPYTTHPPYTEPYMPPTSAYQTTATPPFVPPFVPPTVPVQPRFPAGAVWLIGLGMFFLLSTMGIFHAIPASAFIGVVLLSLGVLGFFKRMTGYGGGIAYDGTPDYNLRVVRALNGPIWLIALGLLSVLDSFRLFRWSGSWPWLIILIGVMMLIKRAAYNAAAAAYVPPVYPPTTPSAYAPPTPEPIVTPPPTTTEARTEEQRRDDEHGGDAQGAL